MRLTQAQTVELYNNIVQLKFGKKPGLFSSSQLKELTKHQKLNELFDIIDEIENAIKTNEPVTELMPKYAKLINTYLDYK
jgi:hypothetical protein